VDIPLTDRNHFDLLSMESVLAADCSGGAVFGHTLYLDKLSLDCEGHPHFRGKPNFRELRLAVSPRAFVGRARRPDDVSATVVPFVAGICWAAPALGATYGRHNASATGLIA